MAVDIAATSSSGALPTRQAPMGPRSDAGDRRRQDRSPADALPMYGRHRSPRTVLASTTTLWSPDCLRSVGRDASTVDVAAPPPRPRQSRGLHQMPEHACRWNLAPGLDQRGRVAPGHDPGPSEQMGTNRNVAGALGALRTEAAIWWICPGGNAQRKYPGPAGCCNYLRSHHNPTVTCSTDSRTVGRYNCL